LIIFAKEKVMNRKSGFTLVELLVVISIIAVLLAVLMPALSKARDSARWIVCGSNLKQWGFTFQGYSTENNGKLMGTVPNGGGPVPAICGMNRATYFKLKDGSVKDGNIPNVGGSPAFNVDSIKSYIPNFDYKKMNFGGSWRCPANALNMDEVVKWHIKYTAETKNLLFPFFVLNYSYFARMDYYLSNKNTRFINPLLTSLKGPHGLTERILSSRTMVMNDTIFQQNNSGSDGGGWSYNHGKAGGSCHISKSNTDFWKVAGTVRRVNDTDSDLMSGKMHVDATGCNQLYGDSSVIKKVIRDNAFLNYKKFAEYAEEETVNSDTQIACIDNGGGDKSYYFPKR
jgi:prepilin-type N-terminal cleavage/methylation domain-containing protein